VINKWHIIEMAAEDSEAQGRCTRQLVQTAVKKQKFRSNQLKEGLSTAEIAT
jgi:hypothetical protein